MAEPTALCIGDERCNTLRDISPRQQDSSLLALTTRDIVLVCSALFAYGVPAVWDEESIATGGPYYSNRTVFRNIQQVPAGHYMTATPAGDISIRRYWEYHYRDYQQELYMIEQQTKDTEGQQEKHIVEEVRNRLTNAIQQRMIADVRVGVYLSGGLDSCSILGIAASLSQQPGIPAFTISFPQRKEFDESALAKEMAKHAQADLHVIEATPTQLAENFESSIYHYEYPAFNLNGVAKMLLSRAVRDAGMKAVMTGEGSDEIFAGYSFFRADYVSYHLDEISRIKGIPFTETDKAAYIQQLKETNLIWAEDKPDEQSRCTSTGSSMWIEEWNRLHRESTKLLGYVPSMFCSIPFLHSCSFFAPALRQKYGHLHPVYYHLSSAKNYEGSVLTDIKEGRIAKLNGSLYLEGKAMLYNILLKWLGDSMEMAHSVEGQTIT